MRFTVIASNKSTHQVSHQSALADGLRAHGIEAKLSSGTAETKYVACWGWRRGMALRAAGHEVLVMERGYLGDRFSWTSLAWNGLNGRGEFPDFPREDSRFSQNFAELKPWKNDGDYILILGQVPGDASLRGKKMMPWYERVAKRCAEIYGKPVHFRPHPLAKRRGGRDKIRNAAKSTGSLNDALAGAALAVTYNSNSAVDAVINGVPAIAMDHGSMAWDVAGHALDELVRPCREDWAASLAWKQWTIDEIASGDAVEPYIKKAISDE